MSTNVSRRTFIAGSAATAAVAGILAATGCSSSSTTTDPLAAPDASAYPIDPDGDDVEALWTSETSRKDGWTKVTNPDGGAELGVMDTAKIIQVNGYAFRDMNGDGKLELWEDWRQTNEARAEALANELTAEEILPLMFHNGFTSTAAPLDDDSISYLKAGMRAGVSRLSPDADNYVESINWINAVQEWCEENDPHGIPYMNSTDPYKVANIPDPHCLASTFDPEIWKKSGHLAGRWWRATGNTVDLGPQIDVGSNPIYCRLGGSVCEDPATNRDFAKAYVGGMQSTWGDDDLTDDQGWGKDSCAAMLKHYVGAGAVEGGRNDHQAQAKYDVFPGDNFNAHLIPFLDGGLSLDTKTEAASSIMPNYGIAYSEDEEYGELVAGAYNGRNLGIPRNTGWNGMYTTDWVVLEDDSKTWGMEDKTEAERFERMIKCGIDQAGGEWMPEVATEGYELYKEEKGEEEALARIRESAARIFTVMTKVQLFDNPYCDREYAKEIIEDEANTEFAEECANKSIVMLKNVGNIINEDGITGKPKCYIPQREVQSDVPFYMLTGDETTEYELAIPEEAASELFEIVTDTVETDADGNQTRVAATAEEIADCEYAVLVISYPDTGSGVEGMDLMGNTTGEITYVPISLQYRPYTADEARDPSLAGDILDDGTKENRSYKGKTVSAENESDLDLVLDTREALPNAKIILIVEGGPNVQCFHEFEPSVDVILYQWSESGVKFGDAYCRILSGEVEPSGLLAGQMPLDMGEVETQEEDVPRDMVCYTDSEGNTYDFCFGLNWSGVIDDDRVSTYSVAALTEPEAEVIPGENDEI